MARSLTFILGGARSGKSDYAQALVEQTDAKVLFVATAAALDEEMQSRIAIHRSRRPAHWVTLEAPRQVGTAIQAAIPSEWVLLDCMTLLVSNLLVGLPEPIVEADYYSEVDKELNALLNAISDSQAKWIIVSNEVGLGLVPAYPMGRYFRDALGRVNQRLAQTADTVYFMVSGLPMLVKGGSTGSDLH
jgi:adenosylcobinamide kinase / adenosylcobinamide-phosphate guanylyltransferase